MLGNFSYCNPTKLYFGKKSLNYLNDELSKYGKNVVLIYGGGSIKKNGIYDAVTALLKENNKNVAEISGGGDILLRLGDTLGDHAVVGTKDRHAFFIQPHLRTTLR